MNNQTHFNGRVGKIGVLDENTNEFIYFNLELPGKQGNASVIRHTQSNSIVLLRVILSIIPNGKGRGRHSW